MLCISGRLGLAANHSFLCIQVIDSHFHRMMSLSASEDREDMDVADQKFCFSEKPTLEEIRRMQSQFAKERDWDQFHQPRNLLLAMVGEVGETAELFQWKGEVKEGLPDWSMEEKHHLAQELSDVLIYLVRLADKCHIDLPKETVEKIALNNKKYPAELVRGSSKKYTEYKSIHNSTMNQAN